MHACGQCLTCSGGVQRGGRQGWRGKVGKNAAMCFFLQAADCSGVCDVTVLRHPFGHPLGRAGKEQGTHPLTSGRTSGFWKRLGLAVVRARRGPVVHAIGAVRHKVSRGSVEQASGRDRVCSRAVGRRVCRDGSEMSRRCLTSPHGGPAGSKNGAAALLGGNGADMLHGAGECRTEDEPSFGMCRRATEEHAMPRRRRRRRCRQRRPSGLLVVHLWVQFSKIILPSAGGRGTRGSQGAGRVGRRRMHCQQRCRRAADPARPGPTPAQRPAAGTALTRRPSALQQQAMPRAAAGQQQERRMASPRGRGGRVAKGGVVAGRAAAPRRPPRAQHASRHGASPRPAQWARGRDQRLHHGPSQGIARAPSGPTALRVSAPPQAPPGSPVAHDGSPPGRRRPRRAWVGGARRAGA